MDKMNLFDIYKHYIATDNDDDSCRYYYGIRKNYQDFYHDFKADEYIKNNFNIGGKQDCISIIPELEKLRYEHMLSLYLLGIYFYDHINIIKFSINNLISNLYRKSRFEDDFDLRREFLYIWYLISLYHDIASTHEDNHNYHEYIPEHVKRFCGKILKTKLLDNEIGIPAVLLDSLKTYMYNYRFMTCEKYDHGLYAAELFHKSMIKLHKGTEHLVGNLLFGRNIYEYLIYPVIMTILVHNIWFRFQVEDEKSTFKYREHGLERLIIAKECSPIFLSIHPLLFLFNLIDTIEPIKYFKNFDYWFDILKNIEIKNICDNTIKIIYPHKECRKSFKNYSCQCIQIGRFECTSNICNNLAFLYNCEFNAKIVYNNKYQEELVLNFSI